MRNTVRRLCEQCSDEFTYKPKSYNDRRKLCPACKAASRDTQRKTVDDFPEWDDYVIYSDGDWEGFCKELYRIGQSEFEVYVSTQVSNMAIEFKQPWTCFGFVAYHFVLTGENITELPRILQIWGACLEDAGYVGYFWKTNRPVIDLNMPTLDELLTW